VLSGSSPRLGSVRTDRKFHRYDDTDYDTELPGGADMLGRYRLFLQTAAKKPLNSNYIL
jgi:hypothetical protein